MEMSVLFYHQPDYLNKASGPMNASDCARYVERAKGKHSDVNLQEKILMVLKTLNVPSLRGFRSTMSSIENRCQYVKYSQKECHTGLDSSHAR
jgi:hypothetical protein